MIQIIVLWLVWCWLFEVVGLILAATVLLTTLLKIKLGLDTPR